MMITPCLVVAMMLCGVPQESAAGPSAEKEKKEEKKQRKGKKEKGSEDKGKSSGGPVAGVNKMFDSFKKGSGAAKDDAGKARKSVNDAYDRSK